MILIRLCILVLYITTIFDACLKHTTRFYSSHKKALAPLLAPNKIELPGGQFEIYMSPTKHVSIFSKQLQVSFILTHDSRGVPLALQDLLKKDSLQFFTVCSAERDYNLRDDFISVSQRKFLEKTSESEHFDFLATYMFHRVALYKEFLSKVSVQTSESVRQDMASILESQTNDLERKRLIAELQENGIINQKLLSPKVEVIAGN